MEVDPKMIDDDEAKRKFESLSPHDKQKVINATEEMKTQTEMFASKILFDLYVMTCNDNQELREELNKILKYDKIGYFMSKLKGSEDQLVLQLQMVPKEYEYNIHAPEKYTGAVYSGIAHMIQALQVYHIMMCRSNPQLIETMRKLRPDIDFSKIHYDDDKRSTFYFDGKLDKRIGVICVWLDKNSKPIIDSTAI